MSKKRLHVVQPPKKDKTFVGIIDMSEVRRKVRKQQPPPVQVHRPKTAYRRKPKHPGKGEVA